MKLEPFCFEHSKLTPGQLTAIIQIILDKDDQYIFNAPDTLIANHIDKKHHIDFVSGSKYKFFGIDIHNELVCLVRPELYSYGDPKCLIQSPTLQIIARRILEAA